MNVNCKAVQINIYTLYESTQQLNKLRRKIKRISQRIANSFKSKFLKIPNFFYFIFLQKIFD